MITTQLENAARAACAEVGIVHRAVPADGRFHETDIADDPSGKGDGRIKYFPDGTGGIAFNWKGEKKPFFADDGRTLTDAEMRDRDRKRQEAIKQAEADEIKRHAGAAKKALPILQKASPATAAHAYLKAKGIGPNGALLHADGRLIIPMRIGKELHSLQFIAADGAKRFLTDGRVKGCYFLIGTQAETIERGAILVCEGFATGATLREATGLPVVVCFTAGNLLEVATFLHKALPDVRQIVAGDFDKSGIGQKAAAEAAQAVSGLVVLPPFTAEELATDNPPSDWNDFAALRGPEAVRQGIEGATRATHTSAPMPAPSPALANATAADSDGWQEPLPLPDGLLPVAAFDFALLPDALTPWARDICERVQCAPDFVAAAIMAGLGSIIGRKLGIRPQARTDWTVTPNQWALVVGRPGVLKSPALEAALSPIKRLAALATEAHQADMEQHRIAIRTAKLRAEEGEKSARKLMGKMPGADVSHLLNTEEPEAPALRRYIAVDSNAASLGELHRQNHNGLLVHRDELVSLLRSLDREDQAEARGFYMTGWNGDSAYTFDRIGRGLNLHIPAVCLSLLGSTQPGRAAEYIRHAVRGGAGDDGLIQRFGLLVWPDTGSEWKNVDRWPDSIAKKEAHRVFEYLDKLDPATVGAQQDTDHDGEPEGIPYLRFDDAALGLFLEWRTDLEARLRGGDLHPALESHLAKYRKLVPSLALILHLANNGTGPVTERAALQALAWAEYLETHARRAYGSVTAPEVGAAKAIISRIRKGDLKREFSSRDVWRPGWAMLSDREQVADALRLLVDYDWLVTATKDDTGGRPATIYTVNPRGFQS